MTAPSDRTPTIRPVSHDGATHPRDWTADLVVRNGDLAIEYRFGMVGAVEFL
jgi:hypothetical protein